MSDAIWIAAGAVLVAIVLVVVLRRNLGWLSLKLPGAALSGGENKSKASANRSTAGRNINVEAFGSGEATANRSHSGRDINVSSGNKKL